MIEIIARGIIRNEGNILLCRNIGRNDTYFYFPGGHVEFGETSKEALMRELEEEIGVRVPDPVLIGGLENFYNQEGRRHHEINIVYAIDISQKDVRSHEPDRLSVHWVKEEDLAQELILPKDLKEMVMRWQRNPDFFWEASCDD